MVVGAMALSGSAAALTVAKLDRDIVLRAEEPGACGHTACVRPVQMPMSPFSGRDRPDAMPADQRELLSRLLSPELSEVVSPAERDLFSQALDRGNRLSADAVRELSAMLREKQGQQARLLTTAKAAETERRRQVEQAAAAAERQRKVEQAAAQAERQRQERAQTAAEAERRRQTEQAAAEADRQRQAELAAAEAERQRQAAADRQRQVQLAAAEAERERQAAEAAQALAEAKREAEEAAANVARLVFYDEFPPLQPL
jgi:hypothetical protein